LIGNCAHHANMTTAINQLQICFNHFVGKTHRRLQVLASMPT
jgi:hypothetical protein